MACHLSIQTIANNPLRIMLHQIPLSWQISDLPKSLHLIEELQQYTTPGFFLSECSFDQLVELVERTYHAFRSTYSAHMALLKDEKAAAEYFSQFFDPSIDASFHGFDVAQGSNNGSTVPGTRDTGDGLRNPEERVSDDGKGDDNNEDEIGIAHLADIDI